jgi:hypothetical protein
VLLFIANSSTSVATVTPRGHSCAKRSTIRTTDVTDGTTAFKPLPRFA